MAYRNMFDRSGQCSEMGESAEFIFFNLLKQRGEARAASFLEQKQHIDFLLLRGKKVIKYEVKARKKINRADKSTNDLHVWVEFHNVSGQLGWLYGKANYVAFEREDDFIIVETEKLKNLALKLCDLSTLVSSPKDALYKAYRRNGRMDLISIIKMSDIESIAKEIWPKKRLTSLQTQDKVTCDFSTSTRNS